MVRRNCSALFVLIMWGWPAAGAEENRYLYCSFQKQGVPYIDLKVKTEGVNQFAEWVTVRSAEDEVETEKSILQLKSAGKAFLVFVISPEEPRSALRFHVYNNVIGKKQGVDIWKAWMSPFGLEEDPYGGFQEYATGGCYIDQRRP